MASAISSIWCVKKIILFGSVATGEEKVDSDIDLAIELFGDVRHSRKFVGRTIDRMIGVVLEPLCQRYTNVIGPNNRIWDIINLSSAPKNNLKVFEMKGFFVNALTMFERAQPELVIDGNTQKFDFEDILGWMDMGQGDYCLLFNGEEPMQIKAIGMDGNDVGWVGLLNFEFKDKGDFFKEIPCRQGPTRFQWHLFYILKAYGKCHIVGEAERLMNRGFATLY
ncbi:MAG: nucleotidyltransferase family protein [Eubacteriales bacterium]